METLVDVPEAYQPVLAASPAKLIESASSFEELAAISPLGDTALKLRLAEDAAVVGVDFYEQPTEFFSRRNGVFNQYQSELQASLPELKSRTVEQVAHYLSEGQPEVYDSWIKTFNKRLSSVEHIDITDDLLRSGWGDFQEMSRRIGINGAAVMKVASGGEETKDLITDTILTHELLHGMLASAVTKDAFDLPMGLLDLTSRNGVMSRHLPGETPVTKVSDLNRTHTWVNEAFIEDIRQEVTGSKTLGYVIDVSILRALQQLDSNLKSNLKSVAFGGAAIGPLTGRLEYLLGPLGVEKVGEILDNSPKSHELQVKGIFEQVADLLPKELREQGLASMLLHWQAFNKQQ